jgi:hypothetical protein
MRTDITFAADDEITNFVGETPAGEAFLGAPKIAIPNHLAEKYLEKAKAAGLSVLPFP